MVMNVIISSEMSRDWCCPVSCWFHYCESMFIHYFSKLSVCFTNVKKTHTTPEITLIRFSV